MVIKAKRLNGTNLTTDQKAIINRAMTAGGALGVPLDEEQCAYLVALTAADLGLSEEMDLRDSAPTPKEFFHRPADELRLSGIDFLALYQRLVDARPGVETYFDCLAALHKRRLKYGRILSEQPIPTLNQVGPRGLLQFGHLPPRALAAFLFWRKWIYDTDNRAAQETGLLFEPLVARCVGGESLSHRKSPVKRASKPSERRQVDCLLGERAYEIKLRVTIAAAGKGRWGEEKEFPRDCSFSGYEPVLLVFDDTQADKLDELTRLYEEAGGAVYVGDTAWEHLEELAGETMGPFLQNYVRAPLQELLDKAPDRGALPDLTLRMSDGAVAIEIGGDALEIVRVASAEIEPEDEPDSPPDDPEDPSLGP